MLLADDLGMSPRNISFLETGRSRPTKNTINKLAKHLNIPIREEENLLAAAGLSPVVNSMDKKSEIVEPFHNAIAKMLENHTPYPAIVFNRWWDIMELNNSARLLLQGVGKGDNLISDCFLNDAWRNSLENWEEVIWNAYYELRSELCNYLDPRYKKLYLEIEELVGSLPPFESSDQPVVCSIYNFEGKKLCFTTMITRFRSAQEVNLSELKLELIFPADRTTESYLISDEFMKQL